MDSSALQGMEGSGALDLNQALADDQARDDPERTQSVVSREDEGPPPPHKMPASSDQVDDNKSNPSSTREVSPGKPAASLPAEKHSPAPPTRGTPPLSNRSRSRSPSPSRRRSDSGHSRSPERKHGHRSAEGRHDWRRDEGRRVHDRSSSPTARSHRRERSSTWSPDVHERNRYRSRYSPRRGSPPARYLSRGDRSPRKRPWSPPRNRNTGLGKPGKHLFVAGFSFATTERDLEKKFGRYGRVRDVRIIRDRRSGDSRGFGFLSLERDEEADAAIRALDQTEWNGRIVLVEKQKTH